MTKHDYLRLTGWLTIGLLLFGGLAWVRIDRYQHYTALVGFGCVPNGPCMALKNQKLLPKKTLSFNSGGYDGQFYYYLAAGIYNNTTSILDDTRLRSSRIGYALLAGTAWLLGRGEALVWSMSLWPLALHLIGIIFAYHFYGRANGPFSTSRFKSQILMAAYVLNPILLLSFLLNLADGLAVELAFLAITLNTQRRRGQNGSLLWIGLLMSLAVLSKETVLVLWPLVLLSISGNWTDRFWQFMASIGIPLSFLLAWWVRLGFAPWHLFRVHGSWPFAGFRQYLQNPDAFFSGRGLLSAMFILYVILFLQELYQMLRKREFQGIKIALQAMLALNLFLIASASMEYWFNFANIARLFTPLVLYPLVSWQTSRNKTIVLIVAILSLLLSWVMINDVLFGKLIPTNMLLGS